jgi:hypothetical protein
LPRSGFIQQGVGAGLGLELVKLTSEYENEQGVQPNVQAQLLAAEANAAFWRLAAQQGGLDEDNLLLIQGQALTLADRIYSSMQKVGLLNPVH